MTLYVSALSETYYGKLINVCPVVSNKAMETQQNNFNSDIKLLIKISFQLDTFNTHLTLLKLFHAESFQNDWVFTYGSYALIYEILLKESSKTGDNQISDVERNIPVIYNCSLFNYYYNNVTKLTNLFF